MFEALAGITLGLVASATVIAIILFIVRLLADEGREAGVMLLVVIAGSWITFLLVTLCVCKWGV